MRRLFIVGATSAIAQHTARLFAARGDAFFLTARHTEKLEAIAQDLRTRGASQVAIAVMDAADIRQHAAVWEKANEALGGIDTVLIAHGILPDQRATELDYAQAERNFQVNFLSPVSLLTLIANDFERQRNGCIAVISSVAGDRGRQSNYVYGSAKAGLSAFLQGLRNRLHRAGVAVVTVKPGLIKTPMTAHLPPSLLMTSPETAARGIYRAICKRKDVAYVPGYWRWVMAVIKSVPETVFKRAKL